MNENNSKLTSANNRWLIETKFLQTDKFEHLLYEGGEDYSYKSLTNFGSQRDLDLDQNKEFLDLIISQINDEFKEQGMPCKAHTPTRLWNIVYGEHGYQCMHAHSDEGYYNILKQKGGILSVVISFDTVPSTMADYNGCLYALLPEPDGTMIYKVIPSVKGKMIIFDGAVWHGVYPTTQQRRVLVCDMKYDIIV